MHSTSIWPSHSKRRRGLPRVSWSLSRLRIVFVLFVSILLPAAEHRQKRWRWRRIRQQRKAALVASRFDLGIYDYRGARTHAKLRDRLEASVSARPPGCLSMPRVGRPERGGEGLNDLLESHGVKVWFSEKNVGIGTPLLREIDKGLAKSQVGIVLVTPAFLRRVQGKGIAEKSFRHSSHVNSSSPSSMARRMKLSAKSAP
jgi:hypothetical protein